MENKDIEIIKKRFPNAKKISALPEYGEHYYSVKFEDNQCMVCVMDGIAVVAPVN